MDHVVEGGHVTIGISKDRKVDYGALSLVDVLQPPVVRLEWIDAECDGFNMTQRKLAR